MARDQFSDLEDLASGNATHATGAPPSRAIDDHVKSLKMFAVSAAKKAPPPAHPSRVPPKAPPQLAGGIFGGKAPPQLPPPAPHPQTITLASSSVLQKLQAAAPVPAPPRAISLASPAVMQQLQKFAPPAPHPQTITLASSSVMQKLQAAAPTAAAVAAASHASAMNLRSSAMASSQIAASSSSPGVMRGQQHQQTSALVRAPSRQPNHSNSLFKGQGHKAMNQAYKPTGKRVWCPFVALAVGIGATVDIPQRPQFLFHADQLIIDDVVAADFKIVAIKIGVYPQQIANGEVSAKVFPAQNGPHLSLDVADSGTDITLTVRNTNAAAKDFYGALFGDVVEPA